MEDFTTPDRKPSSTTQGKEKVTSSVEADRKIAKSATVTPAESTATRNSVKAEPSALQMTSSVESSEDKHVRFGKGNQAKEIAETPEAKTRKGPLSRRGGRSGSPARPGADIESTFLEFKTYRSPQRKREESDTVPSLCSSSIAEKQKNRSARTKIAVVKEETNSGKDNKPASISCDTNMNQTSPLGESPEKRASGNLNSVKPAKSEAKKNNVTFSPVPPTKDCAVVRTPTRSPTKGNFQSLPSLDDATLRSPGAFFLSPQPGTPSYRALQEAGSFDTTDMTKDAKKEKMEDGKPAPMRSPKTPKSPRTPRREDRDRFMATPTDFAADYGKHPNSAIFDSSNVLAWLQSPTANGLFSPGGFASMLNTPKGAPQTPRTTTVSTSFFFSDVAGLPRSDCTISPKPGENGKRGGRGYSNIICISPLASSKTKNGNSHTPPGINYKDIFSSPEGRAQGLSFLGDSPAKGLKARGSNRSANRDPSLDAVHLAERDLMEDEDLSVLLQLASNTPSRTAGGERTLAVSESDGTHVFRPPKTGSSGDENLPALQLPVIGGRDGHAHGARLSRKTHSHDHGDPSDAYRLHAKAAAGAKTTYGKGRKTDDKTKVKGGQSSDAVKKAVKQGSLHPPRPPYSLPHPYEAHPGGYYMPPGMPHGGNMRVVVGGPPPPLRGKAGSPNRPGPHGPRPPYSMGPSDPNYPPPYPPPPGHYHHPGVPPHHMHPHYGHYPPHHHPPPRAHMPLYGAQHPPGKGKPPKKLPKAPKPGTKRPLSTNLQKGSSKKKKSSPPKKKNKSPQLTDKVERQKAAATIQAVNAASGGKNDRAAALAAAILRGVTMRPSGKWQAQLYFAGKSRYIGVFDTREKAALAYEIAREKLKSEKSNAEGGQLSPKATEAAVTLARKAAFEGVNERDPRLAAK